jgi:pyruvate formate lyase activating enzyme
MRCPYCYNPHIVLGEGSIDTDELLSFLHSRVGRLEGVVLSGGECTLYPELHNLCRDIKELGFKVKIDTNGSRPDTLRVLAEEKLIDCVALDFKAPLPLFKATTRCDLYDKTLQSLRFLIQSGINFEVRTTVHTDLLNENAINSIVDILSNENYNGTYYLQNYLHAEKTLGDMQQSSKTLNKELLSDKIRVEFRR